MLMSYMMEFDDATMYVVCEIPKWALKGYRNLNGNKENYPEYYTETNTIRVLLRRKESNGNKEITQR